MSETISENFVVDIDGLPVSVNRAEYEANKEVVIQTVRTARLMHSDITDLHDISPDYDELVSAFGEDDTTEVPDAGE